MLLDALCPGKLDMCIHKVLHALDLQLLQEVYSLPLNLQCLLLLRTLHTLIHLRKCLDRPCQLPETTINFLTAALVAIAGAR
ncbi:Os05g0560750 [Oryza sativa Japonica Group]|uniref:Os05g0560750 protein n=1 Tax=Oryza sativa subsp. japonica TaxID=39947 RepID=A0A0P0WPV7_ORYSJ|nr:hypothetical protein EE612_031134 [Oryza sativa]BAS95316.1 Os05g0560750 [Oryza sativa Japonica Group]